MNSKVFNEFIYSISRELWEDKLGIGNFVDLKIEFITNRKYSLVAKCVILGSKLNSPVYIKYYKNYKNLPSESLSQQVEREYQTIVHYFDKFNQSRNFNIVEPAFVLPDKFVLVTKEAEGENLFQTIKRLGSFFPSPDNLNYLKKKLFQTGAWLKYFHSLNGSVSDEYSISDLLDYINIRFQILTEDERRHFPKDYCQRILDYIENYKSELTEKEKRINFSHSDYNLSNIIINGEQVTVLDFIKIKQDSFLVDISRIYHQLLLISFKPQYSKKIIQQLQKALLEGFGMENAHHLMLFRFFLIRHTLTHLVGITKFWQVNFKERLYNRWILYKELNYLDYLMKNANSL